MLQILYRLKDKKEKKKTNVKDEYEREKEMDYSNRFDTWPRTIIFNPWIKKKQKTPTIG